MLKVIDGLRTLRGDGNFVADIPDQSVAAQVNATNSIEMGGKFAELLVVGYLRIPTGAGTGTVFVQESNEAAANFTNVTNATLAFSVANTVKVLSVDWRDPTRKKYARVCAVNATNAVNISAYSLRVQPTMSNTTLDGSAAQA